MNKRKILFFVSLFVLLVTGLILITGSPILTTPLFAESKVPMGTFITWIGLISLPMTILYGINNLGNPIRRKDKWMALSLKILLVFAVLWVPISYGLSGNISFLFAEKTVFRGGQLAMRIFWYYNGFITLSPIVLLMAYGISSFFASNNRS